jgi:hypothetical protein
LQADKPKNVFLLENQCVECEEAREGAAQKYVLRLAAPKEKVDTAKTVLLCAPNEPARKDWARAITAALQSDALAKYGAKMQRLIVKCSVRGTTLILVLSHA